MNQIHLESIAISALFRFAHFWKVPWRRPYSGGCNSLLSQPITRSVLRGSGRSQSRHWNVRCPLPPGGSAGIRTAPSVASRSFSLAHGTILPPVWELRQFQNRRPPSGAPYVAGGGSTSGAKELRRGRAPCSSTCDLRSAAFSNRAAEIVGSLVTLANFRKFVPARMHQM
jgi:hypothetical protein